MSSGHLAEYLEGSAARYPERAAVVDPAGSTFTYAELNRQADALATVLNAAGVSRGDRVAVVLPKSIAAVVSLFGVMKAGAAYVPIDYSAPAQRSRKILVDCQVKAVIGDRRSASVDAPSPGTIILVDPPFTKVVEPCDAAPHFSRGWEDFAYVLYTSGSTGDPKGVPITHANVLSFIDWSSSVFAPPEEDRISNHAPFHFDYSVLDVYLTIKHGATLYLITDELCRNPRELARYISASRLTVWGSTPSALMMLLQFGNLAAYDSSSLRLVTFGGEVFPPRQLHQLQRVWRSAEFYNMYGPTEITVACTFAKIPEVTSADRDTPYPIGFPCSHCRALVLDEHHREVPPGDEGLLYVSGPSVFGGYWNRPDDAAALFFERDGVRWYNTGDVVRWNAHEGFTYVGRRDRMVKRRGFRIELGEIESALYTHPRILEAAVIAVSDGDAGVRIGAFVCCENRDGLSAVELKTYCGKRLPGYMVPDQFVVQQRLPRTSSDKVDYQALRAQLGAACVG